MEEKEKKFDWKSFVVFKSFIDNLNLIDDFDTLKETLNACFDYWLYWIYNEEWKSKETKFFMNSAIPAIDSSIKRRKANIENWQKGWRPKMDWNISQKPNLTQANPTITQLNPTKPNHNLNGNGDGKGDGDVDGDKKEKIYKKENLESTDLQQTTDIETEDKPVSNKEEREKVPAEKEKEYYIDWDNVIIDWGVDKVDFFIEYVKRICDKLKIKFADYNARKFCKDFLESEEVANRCKEKQIWIPWLLYFTIAVPHKIPSLEQYQPHSFFDIYYKYRTIYEIACWNLQDNKDLYKLRNKSNSREQKFVKEFVYHLKPEDMNKNIQISFNE